MTNDEARALLAPRFGKAQPPRVAFGGERQDGAGSKRTGSAVEEAGERGKSKGERIKARDGHESRWRAASDGSPQAKRARSEFLARQKSAKTKGNAR